jgi:hypothetical protein
MEEGRMRKANFTIDTVPGFVLLEDRGTGKTITNDAEGVVAWLAEAGCLAGNPRILYRDTDGMWDELLHAAGRFAGFAPIRAATRPAALERARGRAAHQTEAPSTAPAAPGVDLGRFRRVPRGRGIGERD